MKTKRSAMVVLVGCLFLLMAHEALAFYNPETGRWLSRDPIAEIGGRNVSAFVANDPLNNSDPFGLCAGSCGGLAAISFPDIGRDLFSGPHKSLCSWLEGKIRSYLSTPEDIRAWNNFIGGSANDIDLSDDEMRSVLGGAKNFQAELKRQARLCCRANLNWDSKKTGVGDMIGDPWSASLGGVSISLTTHCNKCTLTWVACIFDKYDFDPEWFSTHRTIDGELKTILVWAAQNGAQCGWKEFHHKGCWNGFTHCNGVVIY